MEKQTIYAKLSAIQTTLVAPKGQYNTFGKYNYRSCEDILNGVKKHLKKLNCAIKLEDEIVLIGERYYIKATATLIDCESGELTSATASARESFDKKGMDESQITGAASSYARKYALNGLFAIDDTKDADTKDNRVVPENKNSKNVPTQKVEERAADTTLAKVTHEQISQMRAEMAKAEVAESVILSTMNLTKCEDMRVDTFNAIMRRLAKTIEKKAGATNE